MPHLSRFLSGLALMLTLPLSGCLDTGPDVVCVDVERVLSQSKAAQQANEHLGKVQTILQNGLAAYQEELKKIGQLVNIYDAAPHTQNAALDVALSGKMLACTNLGITMTCLADGRRIGFMEGSGLYVAAGQRHLRPVRQHP